MIYITGDTHGEQARFYDKMLVPNGFLTKNDYLIVCGDFGYIFKNDVTEKLFLNDLEKVPYTILFIDGNHENFPAIYSCPIIEWHGGKVHQIRENIFHLMRGEIFEIEGKTFLAMGEHTASTNTCAQKDILGGQKSCHAMPSIKMLFPTSNTISLKWIIF